MRRVSRRDFLVVGALGGIGLDLPDLLRARASAAGTGARDEVSRILVRSPDAGAGGG